MLPAMREVRVGGTPIQVEPKGLDVLIFLIENRDQVVTKDDLIAGVWSRRIVSDATLASAIKSARRMVGDDGERQAIIRTHHGRGFRFVATLAAPAVTTTADEPALPTGDGADIDMSLPKTPSVAIVPFSYAGDGAETLLSTGLTRDITVGLARTRWLFVTAPASSAMFTTSTLDHVEIGQRLGVRYILRGSILQSGNRFRLTVTLCDALSGAEVWAERFDEKVGDIFEVQDQVSRLVVEGVTSEIDSRERKQALLRPFETLDAWSAYHQAIDLLFRFTPGDHDRAESLLNLAARLDPGAARVFAAKSFLSWQRAFMELTPDRDREISLALHDAQQSVSLDPLDPMAHWALGRAELLGLDYSNAIDELQTSVDLNPSFANGHYTLAYNRALYGGSRDGFDSVAMARRISPYDPMTFAYLAQIGAMKSLTGEEEDGAAWVRRAMKQPYFHYHIYALAAWVHEAAGQTDAARGYMRSLLDARPDYSLTLYFRAFPWVDPERQHIAGCFSRLGLRE